jgi:hypothetical protein
VVPQKELLLLSLYLEDFETHPCLQLLIYQCLQNSLQGNNPKIGTIFEQIGLFSIITAKLVTYLGVLDHILDFGEGDLENLTDEWFISQIETKFPNLQSQINSLESLWSNINANLLTLLELIKSNPKLIMKFHQSIIGGYWACLHFDQIRLNCLKLTSTLIELNPEGLNPESWNSPSTLIKGNQILNDLIDYLNQISLKWDKILIRGIEFLIQINKKSLIINQVFGKLKGFSVISSALKRLKKGFLTKDKETNELSSEWELICKCMELIKSSLNNLPNSYQSFLNYYGLEEFQKDFLATGILDNKQTISNGFGLLLSFIMNEKEFCFSFDYILKTPPSSPRLVHLSELCAGSIEYPILIPTLTNFKAYLYDYPQLESTILKSIWSIINSSFRNHLLFSQQPIFKDFLDWRNDIQSRSNSEDFNTLHWCSSILQSLMEFGSGNLGTNQLFKSISNNSIEGGSSSLPYDELDLILKGIKMDPIPDLIHFDLGCTKVNSQVSNIRVDGISSRILVSGGLTWLAWVQILNFDPNYATPMLTLVNSQGVPVYQWILDTNQHLHIQTNFGQGLNFKEYKFEEGEWCHLALVQLKPRLSISVNQFNLIINGKLVESLKLNINTISQETLEGELKLIIGGFPDIKSNSCGNGVYNLASFYGIEESLEVSTIDQIYKKGINYTGTFQNVAPSKSGGESSVRQVLKRSVSLKEYGNMLKEGTQKTINLNQSSGLNLINLENLFLLICPRSYNLVINLNLHLSELSSIGGSFILPNLKYSTLDQAFNSSQNHDGIVRILGKSSILINSPFSHHIWKFGGCSLLIHLLDLAPNKENFETCIKILINCILNDSLFLEEMLRCQGYEVLSSIFKRKPEFITQEIVRELWILVSMEKDNYLPQKVQNLQALRFLIIEFQNFKNCSELVQQELISGFQSLLKDSKDLPNTLGVLHEVSLLKKLLFGLRYSHFKVGLYDSILAVLNRLAVLNFNKETIRTLVAFVTATLSKDRDPDMPLSPRLLDSSSMLNVQPLSGSISSSASNQFDFTKIDIIQDAKNLPHLTHDQQVGNLVLEMILNILQEEALAHQFSVAVTTKWALLFIHTKSNPYQIVLVMRILSRLFYLYGPPYVNRFKTQHQGYLILLKQLPKWWSLTQIYQVFLGNLFGVDIFTIPLECNFDYFSLLSLFQKELMTSAKEMNPDSLLLILSMIKYCTAMYQSPTYLQSNLTSRYRSSSMLMGRDTELPDTLKMPHLDKGYNKEFLDRSNSVGKLIQTLLQILTEFYHQSKSFKLLCSKPAILEAITEVIYPWILPSYLNSNNQQPSRPQSIKTINISGPSDSSSKLDSSSMSIFSDKGSSFEVTSSGGSVKGDGDEAGTKRMHHRSLTLPAADSLKLSLSTRSGSASVVPVSTLNKGETIQSLLEFLMTILLDSIFDPISKPLGELEVILKLAPFKEFKNHLIYESYILNQLIRHLKNQIQLDRSLLKSIKIWGTITKFIQLLTDRFCLQQHDNLVNSGNNMIKDNLLDFDFLIIEILEKVIANDSQITAKLDPIRVQLYKQMNRRIIWHLGFIKDDTNIDKLVQCTNFLKNLLINHEILLSKSNSDIAFWKSFQFNLIKLLKIKNQKLNLISLNFFKIILVKKGDELRQITYSKDATVQSVLNLFLNNLELDLDSFYNWFNVSKEQLSHILFDCWEKPYIEWENSEMEARNELRLQLMEQIGKKFDKTANLRKLELKIYQKYMVQLNQWGKTLVDWDFINNRKISQDSNDLLQSSQFHWGRWKQLTCWEVVLGTSEFDKVVKWKLDFTEGPTRMRKKLKPQKQANLKKSTTMGSIGRKSRPISKLLLETELPTQLFDSSSSDYINSSIKSDDAASIQLDSRRPSVMRTGSTNDLNDSQLVQEPAYADESMMEEAEEEDRLENESDDDDDENKNARVMRLLDLGETIIDAYNIGRVNGLDVTESLLLFCKNNIYVIDGYFYCRNGEIVEISEVSTEERDVYLQLLSDAADIKSFNSSARISMKKKLNHDIRKSNYEDIREVHKRKFLLRNSALEIFSDDGTALLFTTLLEQRDAVYYRLTSLLSKNPGKQSVEQHVGGTKLEGGEVTTAAHGGLSMLSNWFFGSTSLSELTTKWERRELSNFEYIMHLNTLAGRSYNDLTQYPVFPWVLADYTSEELDLKNPQTFRDLSKPMGAQSEPRASEIRERYNTWHESNPDSLEGGTDSPAFHYGTHYSSAMIICWYLIRLEPFTSHHMKLQGGHFDHASRLFHSIKDAWTSASQANSTDVRELIPEFFYLPEFLLNSNQVNFGANQDTGEVINDVVLPPWAKSDPILFVKKHREALESEYVSQNLHLWVDLIFGFKQRGQAAVDALNVFHHLSYGEAVDLDKIEDPVEKAATIGIINNFGQTPQQLFKKPHSPRQSDKQLENVHFSLRSDIKFLIRTTTSVINLTNPVSQIEIIGGKMVAIEGAKRFLPSPGAYTTAGLKYFQWDSLDNSLKLVNFDNRKQLASFENMHIGSITHLICLDQKTFITAGFDQTVTVWELSAERGAPTLTIKANWKGHPGTITCIAGSKSYGYVVVATDTNEATIWDAHRLRLVKRIKVPNANEGIKFISIENSSGNFLLASDHQISVFTINGELWGQIELPKSSPKITSALYLPPGPNEFGVEEIIITGHQGGLVQGWRLEPVPDLSQDLGDGKLGVKWCLTLFDSLVETFDIIVHNFADIVYLKVLPNHQGLICGEVGGKIYQWSFPNITLETHLSKDLLNQTNICSKCQNSLTYGKGLCSVCGGKF